MEAYRKVIPFVEDDVVMTEYIKKTQDFLENYTIEIE